MDFRGPRDAAASGIATVYQDLALVGEQSVASNIYLGREPKRYGIFVDYPRMFDGAREALGRLRIDVPSLRAPVAALSGGQRQAVAVARALARAAPS